MAGQPCKTPSDAQKYRDAYMANLNLQIKNNDKNLQANKLHQRTGVPATQISDYRTTSEKLADVETLRALVRSELLQIADPINAQAIVQKLSVDELQFVAQHIDMIVTDLKPKHRFGVLEPIFRSYLVTQMNAQMRADANVAGLMLENRGVSSLDKLKQLESDTISDRDLTQALASIGDVEFRQALEAMASKVHDGLKILTPQFYKRLESIPDFTERISTLEAVARAIRELPSKKQLQEQVGLITRSQGDEKEERVAELIAMLDVQSLELLAEIEQKVPNKTESGLQNPRDMKDLNRKQLLEAIQPYVRRRSYEEIFGVTEAAFKKLRVPAMKDMVAFKMDILLSIYEDVDVQNEPQLSSSDVFTRTSAPKSRNYSDPTMAVQRNVAARKQIRETEALAKLHALKETKATGVIVRSVEREAAKRSAQKVLAKKRAARPAAEPAAEGTGLKFGKYFLHKDKIKDDIVMVRHKNGRNHPMMPTKRVSKGLGIVLRHIAGGATPSYDDLHRLSDEDRTHLSDLVRICKVDVSVPEGTDKEDLHHFEILRGEIGAGNDSPELIKKLKGVIMRLMNRGRLPKSQAREILMDLAAMGF